VPFSSTNIGGWGGRAWSAAEHARIGYETQKCKYAGPRQINPSGAVQLLI
jgi:hypothetical protein